MTIGEQIRSLRKERGLSQKDLAKMADISATSIGSIERADGRISMKTKEYVLSV